MSVHDRPTNPRASTTTSKRVWPLTPMVVLPFLLTGKGGGTLKPGRVLDYLGKDDDQRKACSLHLSLMDRMGVKLDRFGDAQTRLEDL